MNGGLTPPAPFPAPAELLAPSLTTGTVPLVPQALTDGLMPARKLAQGPRTSVREPADGSPPVCVAPYDTEIVRLPEHPRGIVVSGGVTGLHVDLDELEVLGGTLRRLTDRLDSTGVHGGVAATDVRALEERLGHALAAAVALVVASGATFEVVTARASLAARAADVVEALELLGRGIARAADEAGRLADGLDGARETYARAEEEARPPEDDGVWRRLAMAFTPVAGVTTLVRAGGVAVDIVKDGAARTDIATPALDMVTDLRTPLYLVESVLGTALGRAPKPLNRAGTADFLTEVAHYGLVEPATFMWAHGFRDRLPTPEMSPHPAPEGARRAGTTTQALRTLDAINARSAEGAVGVQRKVRPDGSSSWVVYIPGSEGRLNPAKKGFFVADHARTWGSNTGVLMRRHEQAIRAVERAMRNAGVKDGEKVVFVGHSQGGAIGALLAAKRGSGGLVTVGAPTGGIDLPKEVEAVHIEVEGDEVHELDGRENPATSTRTTVTVRPDEAAETPHAPVDSLHSSVNGVRAAEALEGSAVTAALDGVLGDAGGRPSGPLEESLASPVEVYVPEPTTR